MENAAQNGFDYLQEHLYDHLGWENVRVVINAGRCNRMFWLVGSGRYFNNLIDTAFSRDPDATEPVNTANRMRPGPAKVATTFLRFCGGQANLDEILPRHGLGRTNSHCSLRCFQLYKLISLCGGCGWKTVPTGVLDPLASRISKNCRQWKWSSIVLPV